MKNKKIIIPVFALLIGASATLSATTMKTNQSTSGSGMVEETGKSITKEVDDLGNETCSVNGEKVSCDSKEIAELEAVEGTDVKQTGNGEQTCVIGGEGIPCDSESVNDKDSSTGKVQEQDGEGSQTCSVDGEEVPCDSKEMEDVESSNEIKVEQSVDGTQVCYENDKEIDCDSLGMEKKTSDDGTYVTFNN